MQSRSQRPNGNTNHRPPQGDYELGDVGCRLRGHLLPIAVVGRQPQASISVASDSTAMSVRALIF